MDPFFKYSLSVEQMGTGSGSVEKKACIIGLGLILIAVSCIHFIFSAAALQRLGAEDGLVENLSAANWLLAAVVMFVLFGRRRNVWFLLLGIFFAVCFGEEISWGQRLFGFATPAPIQANNIQDEFNLHNLSVFDRRAGGGGFWTAMHDVGRLFAIVWFLYGIVLPISLKLSGRLRRLVRDVRLPVMPLYIGVFFLINYLIFQYYEDVHRHVCVRLGMVNHVNVSSMPVELREWFESLLFLTFSLGVMVHSRAASRISALDKRDEVAFASRRPGLELLNFRSKRSATGR